MTWKAASNIFLLHLREKKQEHGTFLAPKITKPEMDKGYKIYNKIYSKECTELEENISQDRKECT